MVWVNFFERLTWRITGESWHLWFSELTLQAFLICNCLKFLNASDWCGSVVEKKNLFGITSVLSHFENVWFLGSGPGMFLKSLKNVRVPSVLQIVVGLFLVKKFGIFASEEPF